MTAGRESDELLVERARRAIADGRVDAARRDAALLYDRNWQRARLQIVRRVARDAVDDVCGHLAERASRYVTPAASPRASSAGCSRR